MSLFTWLDARWSAARALRRWVMPTGRRNPDIDAIKAAAAADVAAMEEERHEYFSPDAPGDREDDL